MAPAKLISFGLAVIAFFTALRILGVVVGPLVSAWRLGPKIEVDPAYSIPGWGGLIDPVGDCTFQGKGNALRIDVPGTLHDLSVERASKRARVLDRVEGDFVAEVTVEGRVAPGGDRTSSYALPYHGAGLLIWLDRDNYVRLERAAILRGGELFHYVNFEQRTNANMEFSSGQGTSDWSIRLRLERRGPEVSAAYRQDGQEWVHLPKRVGVRRWGGSLKVGVAAINTATDPFVVEFRDFCITP